MLVALGLLVSVLFLAVVLLVLLVAQPLPTLAAFAILGLASWLTERIWPSARSGTTDRS